MGFPLSTDIFGQLKWLVKQVKLLIYRVTKLEHSGGGGAQTLDQVLATGNTATAKKLVIEDTALGAKYSIIGDTSGWGVGFIAEYTSGFGGRSQMAPGYTQHFETSTSCATMYQSSGINFYNTVDTNGILLKQDHDSSGSIFSAILSTVRLDSTIGQYVEAGFMFDYINSTYKIGAYGNTVINTTHLEINDAQGYISTNISGQQAGLFIKQAYQMLVFDDTNMVGFTNNVGNNQACLIGDTTGNTLNGTQISVGYGNNIIKTMYSGGDYGFSFDFNNKVFTFGDAGGNYGGMQFFIDDSGARTIYAADYGNPKGLLLDFVHNKYIFGEDAGGSCFGFINDTPNTGLPPRLYGTNIRSSNNYFNPAGTIPIEIDGTTYYIELWN